MKITVNGDTVNVSDIHELATDTALSFQNELDAAFQDGVRQIDIDLSCADFVDCGGLGALAAVRKKACNGHGGVTVRLLDPPQPVRRMIHLMHMDSILPIACRGEEPSSLAA